MNTILIVLIVVVIYLIYTTSPKKEDWSPMDLLNLMGNSRNYDCSNVDMNTCNNNPLVQQICQNECARGTNSVAQCKEWAFRPSNECAANPGYMLTNCAKACEDKKAFDEIIKNIPKFR